MRLTPLPDIMIEPLVHAALLEDLGIAGDVTTDAIILRNQQWKGVLVARQAGVLAGIDAARIAFKLIDPNLKFEAKKPDGGTIKPKDVLAVIRGSAAAILTAERVALNFLCHLSGIATATRQLVDAARPHKPGIVCTRKTTPGLRGFEKYAVRAGGGGNQRFGLDYAMLIKDNHIAAAGGVRRAVELARANCGHLMKIELEVDTLAQLRAALDLPIDAVLLDNMDPATLKKAVALVKGRFITEASGGVTLKNVKTIAASGVDVISVGWITHSAPILDIGLDEI
jgi:nicotinate-nucleotide pyrophosphorylase (carboxylating)